MTTEQIASNDEVREKVTFTLDRHSSRYRTEFVQLADDLHERAPVAFNTAHEGYWFASGNQELFDLARRADVLSNDKDVSGDGNLYGGISIPTSPRNGQRGGFLEMDPPEQKDYRHELNAYLSPAAVARWQPIIDEITRATIDDFIEKGRVDFVDDLANIVPAVFTMAMLGLPLKDWIVYCEPMHASIYTPPDSPDYERVSEMSMTMGMQLYGSMQKLKEAPMPGLVDALLNVTINGKKPDDIELIGVVMLIVGGGFDTTTALTAHALEWLSEHPDQREWLSRDRETLLNSATEEFLRFYTPAQGDGRTITRDVEIDGTNFKAGDRLWLSWAMSNRDAKVFEDPHEIKLDRAGNRHASFGLGIHRCIGSNVARAVFKTMLLAVLDRLPDFVCEPDGAVHYDTTGVINGMKHLPATFTPGKRLGPGLDETLEKLQAICDEQRLAEPVTISKRRAQLAE